MAQRGRVISGTSGVGDERPKQAPEQVDAIARRLLRILASGAIGRRGCRGGVSIPRGARRPARFGPAIVEAVLRDDLAVWTAGADGQPGLAISDPGRARLARSGLVAGDPFRAQHGSIRFSVMGEGGALHVVAVNDAESTLAWLARRRGPDGAPLISAAQFAAGERLRADLTRAHILPRVTANWSASAVSGRRGEDPGVATDAMIDARRRVDIALDDVGREFAGLLVDVCGFLKRLPEVERDRCWPARSAKLVLDFALTRLARHYGYETEARGPDRSAGVRFWGAADYRPRIEETS